MPVRRIVKMTGGKYSTWKYAGERSVAAQDK
jgi:hypothetical protein